MQKPRPPILIGGYVDAVLKRAATKGDGWLTYYYTADSFARAWAKVRGFAEEAGRDPDTLISTNQLPICIGPRAKIEAPMKQWLQTEWDYASWSESTMESAIMGTVEECVEQLEPHLATGIDRIIFVPYRYESEQVEAVAKEIIPRLRKKMAVSRPLLVSVRPLSYPRDVMVLPTLEQAGHPTSREELLCTTRRHSNGRCV